MDSLTQMVLGAAVGDAVLGRRIGRRALVWGAVCGTLPDLDMLMRLGDPVADMTYHRSWSHSVLVQALATPLVVWAIRRIHPEAAEHRARWYALVYLAFATHALLDCFTVYGTQILWPLPRAPESWSTVFIIDPLYTLPLAVGVVGAWRLRPRSPARAARLNAAGLALSTLYLVWSVGAKLHVEAVARESLARQELAGAPVLTTPMPFNTLLWRVVAMDAGGYHEGYYSLVAADDGIDFERYPSRTALLDPIADHWPVARLRWFTHGFYSVGLEGTAVVMTDLRMGAEPDYIFRFVVGERANPRVIPTEARQLRAVPRLERLGWMWRRIWRNVAEEPRPAL